MASRAAYVDQQFILKHVSGFKDILTTSETDGLSEGVVTTILGEIARVADGPVAKVWRSSDLSSARLEAGKVYSSQGFAHAYEPIAKGGWIGMSADAQYGGLGLPLALSACADEMFAGGCMALQLQFMLSQGVISALETHGSDALKSTYLPKLISGEWSGTMNLTEAQAGSDLAALRCQAVSNDDGSYAISGQKLFITWGDSDLVENVCHLVLARLPDAPAGSKGISLFLVPKFLPDDQGGLAAQNTANVVSLEHKLGLHGCPTCVMDFDAAKGWLVGAPNQGLAAMFTMMNHSRLAVAMQAVGGGEAALQKAVAYAQSRVQGKTVNGDAGIIGHSDVRKMLAVGRAKIFAARAIGLSCATAQDRARQSGDPAWAARAAFLIPIAKAFCTEMSQDVADMAVQVHGGMGYIEETGAAQYLRDLRITSIYEGTNGIQAMDLVGRKLADDGEAAFALIHELEEDLRDVRLKWPDLGEVAWAAMETLRETTEALLALPIADRQAGGSDYLRGFALVLGACYHLKAALADPSRLNLARVMLAYVLPAHQSAFAQSLAGSDILFAVSDHELIGDYNA